MDGLYILDGHLIANGTKKAIVTPNKRSMAGYHGLVVKCDGGATLEGIVQIGEPESINVKAFDSMYDVHQVSEQDRMRWWPGRNTLYIHKIVWYESMTPIPVELPPGTGMRVTLDEPFRPTIILSKKATDSGWLYEIVEEK